MDANCGGGWIDARGGREAYLLVARVRRYTARVGRRMGWGARPAVVGRRPSTVLRGLVVVVVVVVMIVVAVVVVMVVTAAAAATSPAMDPVILIRISQRTIVVVVVVSDCRVVAGAPYPCMRGSARSLPPDISQL